MAFQIADDLLDATSSAQELGKNPSDAALGKSTYVSLFGVEEAGRKARELVAAAVAALEDGGVGRLRSSKLWPATSWSENDRRPWVAD